MRRFFVIIFTAVALAFSGAVNAEAINAGSHICLTNHSGSCVDVKDNTYQVNQPLWLFSSSTANALGFGEIDITGAVCDGDTDNGCNAFWGPFTDHRIDTALDGDVIAVFNATDFNNLCIGEFDAKVMLKGNCGNPYTEWVKDSNDLINVERTNAVDEYSDLTATNTADGTLLTLNFPSVGWQQWTITCCHNQ